MISVEHVHGGFTKYHLNREGEEPWPFRPVLHQFTTPDLGDPHDHPWDFETYVRRGSYIEEVYTLHDDGSWSMRLQTRERGCVYRVTAEHIHRIVALPQGECWTDVEYGPTRRESLFYKFDGPRSIRTRPWHQKHW